MPARPFGVNSEFLPFYNPSPVPSDEEVLILILLVAIIESILKKEDEIDYKSMVDKICRFSNYHLLEVDITFYMNGYLLFLNRAIKVNISLPGSVSE